MRLSKRADRILFPLVFALIVALPYCILLPMCLVRTTSMLCKYFYQFGMIPARVLENFEFYRIFTANFVSGTPWQAVLNAFMVYVVMEAAQTRIYLRYILLYCFVVATTAAVVYILYALAVQHVENVFFAREYYMPQYGIGPVLIFMAVQNLRSHSLFLCKKIPGSVLSIAMLLVIYAVYYPIVFGWVWNLVGFVMGWVLPPKSYGSLAKKLSELDAKQNQGSVFY